MRLVLKNKWWQFETHSNKHESEAPTVRDTTTKERAVDPPWRIKTTMGMRDNSRWRKECYKRNYDQRITVDHGEWCIWYDFET